MPIQLLPTAAILALSMLASPLTGAESDIERLNSYIGSWNGSGELKGAEEPETFRCRLSVSKGNQAKINYSGRCSLVNMNLSVAGTIAYDDGDSRYEAVMSSNVGFKGDAIGRKQGNRIVFNLKEREEDRGGNEVEIGAVLELSGDTITVDFSVEFNNSGDVMTAKVPFSRS